MTTISRATFLKQSLSLATLPIVTTGLHEQRAEAEVEEDDELPVWPIADLMTTIKNPIIIRSVDLFEAQGELLLVVNSTDGAKGVTQCNDRMRHLTSLLKGLVIPHFIDKDARLLPSLVDNAYRLNSNYKYAGMPLWNCIGSVEIAMWDMLGKVVSSPAYELLGKKVRNDYSVYISDFNREGDPEKIAGELLIKLQHTGSKGVKIKVGGRMTNAPENTTFTRRYVPVLRKVLGDDVIIYADANGSYSPKEGIETGRLLEDHGVSIFEEPCNFEDEEGLRKVARSLRKLHVAGGEQDSSVYRFRRLARTGVYDILQPDVYYNGGVLRTLQVAEICKKYGKKFAPHTPKADPLIAPFWHVAALVPDLFGLQESVYNPDLPSPTWYSEIKIINGMITIPSRHGLGIEYDESIWKGATKII